MAAGHRPAAARDTSQLELTTPWQGGRGGAAAVLPPPFQGSTYSTTWRRPRGRPAASLRKLDRVTLLDPLDLLDLLDMPARVAVRRMSARAMTCTGCA